MSPGSPVNVTLIWDWSCLGLKLLKKKDSPDTNFRIKLVSKPSFMPVQTLASPSSAFKAPASTEIEPWVSAAFPHEQVFSVLFAGSVTVTSPVPGQILYSMSFHGWAMNLDTWSGQLISTDANTSSETWHRDALTAWMRAVTSSTKRSSMSRVL